MLFKDLTEEQFNNLKATVFIDRLNAVESEMNYDMKQHYEGCQHCKRILTNLASYLTDIILDPKALEKHDTTIISMAEHAGVKLPKHCHSILDQVEKCRCLRHELDSEHCCECKPMECIKEISKT